MRALEKLHPLPCFLYFLAVMGITIFTRNPVMISEALAGGIVTAGLAEKLGAARFLLITALIITFTNPLFSHGGVTALFFVGNLAITLEALVCGAAFGGILCAAALWGAAMTRFMTGDKFIWLFGRALPSAGLLLSCAMRFVPLFIGRANDFIRSRGSESVKERLSAFSASINYSAEEAISSADSMRSRGYGSAKRTFYSNYRLTGRDARALAVVLLCGTSCLALSIFGAGTFRFYPALSAPKFGAADNVLYICFGVLCALPAAMTAAEALKRRAAGR